MNRKLIAAAVILAAIALAVLAVLGLHGILTRGPEVNAGAKPGEVRWKAKAGMLAFGAAATGDTVLCHARSVWAFGDNRLVACDAKTGKRLWARKTVLDASVSAMATGGECLVFNLADWNAKLEALDARTGKRRWVCPWILPSPCGIEKLDDKTVLACGSQGVQSITLKPLRGNWDFSDESYLPLAGPHCGDGKRAYLSSYNSKLLAIDALTGREVWNVSLGGNWAQAIAAGGDAVCTIDPNGWLRAFDAATGAAKWDTGQKTWNTAGPAVSSDRLFVADASNVVCLSLADGKEVWSTPFGSGGGPAYMAASGGVIYYGSVGIFAAFDAATGETLWQPRIEGRVVGAPVFSGDTVYFATDAGWLYAVAAETAGDLK